MRNLRGIFGAAILALTAALATAAPSTAQAQGTLSYWNFNGLCADCAEQAEASNYPVSGVLTLRDYTLGDDFDLVANFVSFQYNGSNLLNPYYVYGQDAPAAPSGFDSFVATTFEGYISGPDDQHISLYFLDGSGEEGGYFDFNRTTSGDGQILTVGWNTCAPGNSVCYGAADYGFDGSFQQQDPTHPVPEPASLSLLAVGVLGLVGVRRRNGKTC